MSRPDDIPQDVWREGEKLCRALEAAPTDGNYYLAARSILAERERCAKVADEEIERAREFGPHHIPVLSAIARAIRTGATHG